MLNQKLASKIHQSLRQSWVFSGLMISVLGSTQVLLPVSLGGILTVTARPQPAQAALLMDVRFDPNTHQLELALPLGVEPQYSVLGQPTRIIVDLPNTEVSVNTTQVYQTGAIRQVKISQFNQAVARVELELAPDLTIVEDQTHLKPTGTENNWVLRPTFTEVTLQPSQQTLETTSFSTTPLVEPPPAPPISSRVETSAPDIQPLPYETPPSSGFQVPIATFGDPSSTATASAATLPAPLPAPLPTSALPYGVTPPAPSNYLPGVPYATIPFGQPLPRQSLASGQASNFGTLGTLGTSQLDILLPKGTRLSLLYPGTTSLPLEPKPDRQDVLLLQGGVIDTNGNTIIPVNTPVVGHFETDRNGSYFVVEAIHLNGRTIPLNAKSFVMDGDKEVEGRTLFRNSGIGGLGIFILSGLSGIGLLAGAAAGAATTYVTAPQPATIEPGQIVEVRLMEDFLLSNLY